MGPAIIAQRSANRRGGGAGGKEPRTEEPRTKSLRVEGNSMSTMDSFVAQWQFNRPRTLGLLDKIEQEKEPQQILGWRPGPGRAHIAWQLAHIGITEELFATERLIPGAKPAFADLVPR